MYRLYGAKGVRVCRAWHDFQAFQAWAQSSGYRHGKGLSLRVRSRGYAPGNCAWAIRGEVVREGFAASGRGIRAFGETKSAEGWGRDPRAVVNSQTIRVRIRSGVPAKLAITSKRVTLGQPSEPRAYRPIDWARARRMHLVEGLDTAQVAKRLGASYSGLRDGLRRRGWLRERPTPIRELKHGVALHRVWSDLRERHGERTFAPEWRAFPRFHAWALPSGYQKGLVIARLDRREPHGPKNCVWLPRREALKLGRPKRVSRTPRWTITAFGETKGPMAWSRDPRCTVTLTGLAGRLKRGWKPEDAITGRNYRASVEIEGKAIEAFGMTKSLAAWERDRRARVNGPSIARRIRRGIAAETAITTPAFGSAHDEPHSLTAPHLAWYLQNCKSITHDSATRWACESGKCGGPRPFQRSKPVPR